MHSHKVDLSKLASTPDGLRDLVASDADWIVRDQAGMHRLRATGHPALAKLSEPDFKAFTDSLEFQDGALARGNYKPLMSLTLSEVHDVLHRFGGRLHDTLQLDSSCIDGNCQSDPFGLCGSLTCRHDFDHPDQAQPR